MGFFSDITDKIFGRREETVTQSAEAGLTPKPTQAGVSTAAPAPAPQASAAPDQTSPAASGGTEAAASTVDVAAILDEAVSKSGQTLDWRHSIVDLMKALGIDSSLSARKELAAELNYSGDTNDSATMNMWLHRQVLQKLAANGGKVPADLL